MPLFKKVDLGPGHIVLDGDAAPTAAPPHFRPTPVVAKWSPISATAELLLFYSHTHTQPFYGSFFMATRVSRCQKETSGLYGARKITEADTWTIRLGTNPSGLLSDPRPSSPPPFLRWMPFLSRGRMVRYSMVFSLFMFNFRHFFR